MDEQKCDYDRTEYNYLSCTYDPADNKMRLYSSCKLDDALYKRVKAAGFHWAPKQEFFVAPMWTPFREDLLLELCGEIGDEDTSLVARAEDRADRFNDYSDKRGREAEQAHDHVSSIANGIPLGQPILVGHHSEKRARKDAERIHNGMRKAISLWETSKYWTDRAASAIQHARYKELPGVRARRIKTIEADKRKQERAQEKAQKHFEMWTKPGLTLEEALYFCGQTDAGWLTLPRKEGDKEDWHQSPHAHDALTNSYPSLYAPRSLEEIVEVARLGYPKTIAWCQRWIDHFNNRLLYEKAMLEEQGASKLLDKKPRPAQLPICNYRQESFQLENRYHPGEFETLQQIDLTAAAYKKIYEDHRGTRRVENSHRIRICLDPTGPGSYLHRSWVAVFITDSKTHEKPAAIELSYPKISRPVFESNYKEPERTKFDDLKDTMKAGITVVASNQLFATPSELACAICKAADIEPGHAVLEPSAGTGSLLKALPTVRPKGWVTAIEITQGLIANLQPWADEIICADFLECTGLGPFDRIVMNPPFERGADIKHIRHALAFLKPGGRLVSLCANGPRQQEAFKEYDYEALPAGSFSSQGTEINVAMVIIDQAEEEPQPEPQPEVIEELQVPALDAEAITVHDAKAAETVIYFLDDGVVPAGTSIQGNKTMARQTRSVTVYFQNEKERQQISKAALDAGLSESNYFRQLAGLPILKHGGARVHAKKEA